MRRLALAILLGIVATPVAAQQGDTVTVTLERALEIARAGNPEYRRAVNNLDLNAPQTLSTWAGAVLPSVFAGVNTSYQGNLTRQANDPFGNPVVNPNAEYLNFSSTQQTVGLQWRVQGLSAFTRARQQRVVNASRDLEERLAGERLRLDVQRRFFAALQQEELLAAETIVADAVRTDQETAERLFELALKSRIDVLQADLEVQRQALAAREQAGRRDQARLALRTALGQQDLPPVKPGQTAPPIFDPTTLDAETLVGRAVQENGAVRTQESALRQADAAVSLARGSYWPELQASYQLSRYVQTRESTTSLFSLGSLPDRRFSLSLSIPFFNNVFGNRSLIVAAEVARDNQRDALRQAELAAEQAARSAVLALQNQWETIRIAERALAIAGEALELAREEYRLGTRTFDQLQQSVADEAQTRRQQIEARYEFVAALLDLEAAVGGPVR